jgi:PAS domain S-box-containing protein
MNMLASQAVPSHSAVTIASTESPHELPREEVTAIASEPDPTIEENERLRLAATAGQIGLWEWDPNHDIHVLSDELHRIFGIPLSDPDHVRKWTARVFPEDWPRVQELMRLGSKAGQMEFEYRYIHPDVGLRWLFCKGCRFAGETQMFGIVQDITARKATEEASQRLAAIIESSDDAIAAKNLDGIVTSWNPAAEKMFGYTAREMIGRSITTIIPPELHQEEVEILSTIGRGERIEHFETIRVRKDGGRIEVSVTISPVRDQAGIIVGAAKIARDITQRKKAEQALLVSGRLAAVGRLAATVAHEINNPLEAITNLIYLARTSSAERRVRDFLETAEEELARVSLLTRQTLGFYRETSGGRLVRPSEIVGTLSSVFASRMRSKGIQFIQEIRDDSPINAVPAEMRQVLANLVSNSIDAIQGPGTIRIRVSSGRNWRNGLKPGIRITVADTGTGISAPIRSHIFEPFYTAKRDVGTGLGLWVCKSIVDNHKGTIAVRSEDAPGRSWTVFSVFFPFGANAPVDRNPLSGRG